jgi:tetratricopeptide (TPR) repeat protein
VEFWIYESLEFHKKTIGPKKHVGNDERAFNRLIEAAIALLQIGNYPEARKVLLSSLEYQNKIQEPTYLEWILSWLSITREETEQYQQWTDFFSAFIARSPDYALAYHLRAESLWYGGKFREALADYSRALELNPNDLSALSGRG